MGKVDLTQVNSSVQVTGGDAEGAKITQETIVRNAPLISQAVSLGYAIAGDIEGAKKVQNEFLKATSEFAEGAPVLRHVEGLGHHIAGNHERSGQIMMDATKNTVVGLATIVCTRGEPVTVTTCDVGSNALADSDVHRVTGKVKRSLRSKTTRRCRRSIMGASNPLLFDSSLPDTTLPTLPGSVNETLSHVIQAKNTQDLVSGILSLFYILKLMMFGHSQSRPYYEEICQNQFAYQNRLQDCENDLFNALQKYQQLESSSDTSNNNTLEPALLTSLGVLLFELTEMESKSIVGKGLAALMCTPEVTFEANTKIDPESFSGEEAWKFRTSPKSCVEDLFSGLANLKLEFSKFSTNILKRIRRSCTPNFGRNHVQDTYVFNRNTNHVDRGNLHNLRLPQRRARITENTVIPRSQVHRMRHSGNPVLNADGTQATRHRNPLYEINGDFLQQNRVTGTVERISGQIRYTIDAATGRINHMDPPIRN